jgi:hypothetical protein
MKPESGDLHRYRQHGNAPLKHVLKLGRSVYGWLSGPWENAFMLPGWSNPAVSPIRLPNK